MDILNRILQENTVHSTQIEISFRSNIVVKEYCSILVSNKKRIPNQTKLVEQLLRAKYVTPSGKPSLTQAQLSEQSGKISAKIKQHTQPTQNTIFGLSHPG